MVRYVRKTADPVRGMIRRVRTAPYEFLERSCPACRTRAVVVLPDSAMRTRVDLPPSLLWDAGDLGFDPLSEWMT